MRKKLRRSCVTEAELQRAVLDLGKRYGWVSFHVPDSRRVTARGMPDLVMINEAQSRVLFAELKTTKGKLRPEQVFWLRVLGNAGVETAVWRPEDLIGVVPAALRPRSRAALP
jgi:hypothetical protein